MKKVAYIVITFYQALLSPDQGFFARARIFKRRNICVFYPTCSEYAKLAIQKHGFFRGVLKTIWRICRCHPLQKNHTDLP